MTERNKDEKKFNTFGVICIVASVVALIIILVVIINFANSVKAFFSGIKDARDPELYKLVTVNMVDETVISAEYQGNKYIPLNNPLLSYKYNNDDVEISWERTTVALYTAVWFGEKKDTPIYIRNHYYNDGNVYVREDYDIDDEMFVLNGTDREIVFSKMFDMNAPKVYCGSDNNIRVCLYAKSCQHLVMETIIFKYDNNWYFENTGEKLSDDFVKLLMYTEVIID